MKRGVIVVSIIAALVILITGGVFYLARLRSSAAPEVAANSGWKVYQDTADGLSFEYPSTFAIDKQDNTGYSDVQVTDPQNHAVYVSIITVDDPTQSNDPTVKEMFTGPYPKEIPATGNDSAMTVDQRTLNGLQGIEVYGYIAEGSEYSDVFMYQNDHLWEINLDPVLEGRIATYPEPGTPTPDKDTYEQILGSIKISS